MRYAAFGEGDYTTTEAAIRALLAQAGAKGLGVGAKAHDVVVPSIETTPETYLGTARAAGWVGGEPLGGTHTYAKPSYPLSLNDFSYTGTWTIGPQQALAGARRGDRRRGRWRRTSTSCSRRPATGVGHVAVSVDGRPTKTIDVTEQRLYQVAGFASDTRHEIHLRFSPAMSGYSFTFG